MLSLLGQDMREDELRQCKMTCRSLGCSPTPLQSLASWRKDFFGFPIMFGREEGRSGGVMRSTCYVKRLLGAYLLSRMGRRQIWFRMM